MTSCKGQEGADLNREEAMPQFKAEDIDFIMESDTATVRELAERDPSGAFYMGLLVRDREGAKNRSLLLFQEALKSPAVRVREEAARELILPVLAKEITGDTLPGIIKNTFVKSSPNSPLITLHRAARYALGDYSDAASPAEAQGEPSSWDRVIPLAATLKLQQEGSRYARTAPETNILRGKLLGFLLAGTPDRVYTWIFQEIVRQEPEFFTEAESSAVLGRFAVANASYSEALRRFRLVLEQDRSLFFQYPDLTGDLGRTFQYTGDGKAQTEGIKLFLEWENAFQTGIVLDGGADRGNPAADISQIRFRVLYFLGRIERRRQNYTQAAVYFEASLPFAPDHIQEDAAVWYILDVQRSIKPENLLPAAHTYLERRHDPSYFSDILDHLCRYLTVKRQWKDMLGLFPRILVLADGGTKAKYAYILGRALAEGYISVIDAENTLYTSGMGGQISAEARKTAVVRSFFRIAFEEGRASFYYRAMSASQLGDTVSPVQEASEEPEDFPHTDEMDLILGFFKYGAAPHSLSYIKAAGDRLSASEMRIIARALADHEMWIEAIRLVNAYILREDYGARREDMTLYYPRAYREIIERNAEEAGIPPEIFYGLIRTESAFDASIQSHVGAVGLTQLMPPTAREEAERIRRRGGPNYLDNLDLRDPAINVHIGASYLSRLLGLMKSPMQALLSYNGGYNRVQRWRAAEPKLPEDLFLETVEFMETREYGKQVLGAAAAYGYLYFDMTMEAVAAEIFK
ncbi:MAG: lytic transglycosylase domain-containing protein [Spirochaetaceae bacterium]|nr:lytic transglycosylase domain-containing protein [Spirochaetaceae bacterium]